MGATSLSHSTWVLYGAYGYTGVMIAEEAVRRGHRPVLAGRDPAKLEPIASRLGLEHRAVSLDDTPALDRLLADAALVLHAAGPFSATAAPMVEACVRTKTHYTDITGEVRVFEANLARDTAARDAGIAIMSGVGFDVVPTDCAARYVANRIPDAATLEIAFHSVGPVSGGTAATGVESVTDGILVRRGGKIVRQRAGAGAQRIELGGKERTIVPFTWGDVATAYRTTGIPDITVHLAMSRRMPMVMRVGVPVLRTVMRLGPLRRAVKRAVQRRSTPSAEGSSAHVWARARNARGESAAVELGLAGTYPFTASSSVLAVERLLAGSHVGALTPALAFGADFVLEVPGTTRADRPGD